MKKQRTQYFCDAKWASMRNAFAYLKPTVLPIQYPLPMYVNVGAMSDRLRNLLGGRWKRRRANRRLGVLVDEMNKIDLKREICRAYDVPPWVVIGEDYPKPRLAKLRWRIRRIWRV